MKVIRYMKFKIFKEEIFIPAALARCDIEIEDIYFFEVITKYISSYVLKIPVISRVGSTSEIADIFNL